MGLDVAISHRPRRVLGDEREEVLDSHLVLNLVVREYIDIDISKVANIAMQFKEQKRIKNETKMRSIRRAMRGQLGG